MGVTLDMFSDERNPRECAAGEVIFSAFDMGFEMYVVLEGQVELTIDGKVLEVLGPGEPFGTLANGRQGGNGAPPGVRLIDMPVMPLPPGTGMPPPGETRFSPTEVVLQFGAGVTAQQIAQIGQRFCVTLVATRRWAA